jgi:hypothetical protein
MAGVVPDVVDEGAERALDVVGIEMPDAVEAGAAMAARWGQ